MDTGSRNRRDPEFQRAREEREEEEEEGGEGGVRRNVRIVEPPVRSGIARRLL